MYLSGPYEKGGPAKLNLSLRFPAAGAREGELVFVPGHPGRTSRLLTVAELESLRDLGLPFRLSSLKRLEVLLEAWSARSEEDARRAKDDLFGVKNARKALDGRLAGLLDPALFSGKIRAETLFKQKLAGRAEFGEALK